MRRRATTSPISPLRSWSRRLPSLAAAAFLSVAASRAGAQQAQLGSPLPMGAPTPTVPTLPTPVPTTLPALPTPGGSPLTPSSLQSRQTVAATPKVADQKAILTEPIIPLGGAPQPTMAELRQSLRDDGLKNMGMPEFTRQLGAKPPTPPAGMQPATQPSSGWSRFFSRSSDTTATASTTTVLTPSMTENAPAPRSEQPVAPQTTGTPPPAAASSGWSIFSRTPSGNSVLPPSMTENAPAPRPEPPVVQQTSGTTPPEQPSFWYRLTHRSTPNETPQPTGPMVLPEATPLRMQ